MTEAVINAPTPPPPGNMARRLLYVAWWAIVAGFALQLLVLGAKVLARGAVPGADLMAEIGSGISWSVLVCGGVALGTAAAKPSEAVMGVLGFFFAPFGFAVAKGVQRGIQTMLEVPVAEITNATWVVGTVKAVEYGALGVAVAVLLKKATTRARTFIGLGLLFGAVFGSVIVAVSATQAEDPLPKLVGTGVNELFFPAACALILYSASRAGKYVRGTLGQQAPRGSPA